MRLRAAMPGDRGWWIRLIAAVLAPPPMDLYCARCHYPTAPLRIRGNRCISHDICAGWHPDRGCSHLRVSWS